MKLWERNLYSLWFGRFIAIAGLTMVMPFLPLYIRELGITGREAIKLWSGFIYAAPFMISVFMQPLWGIMGDRYGRKPMVVRGMLGLAAAFFLMGFSHTVFQLLVFRFFQGVFSGFAAPSLALQASCTPEDRMGQALGTLQSAQVTGFIVGPLLGGLLSHLMGYRPIFFWTGACCLTGALIVVGFVREEFIKKGEKKGSRLRQNLLDVYRSANLRTMLVLLIMVQVSIQIVTPFLSLYVEYLKVSPDRVGLMTGLVFGITGVTNALTTPFWGKRADRVGYRKILRYSLYGMTLFYLPQAFVTNVHQLLFLRAALGVFVGGAMPTINSIVQRSSAAENRGAIYGIFQSGLLLGNMAGPLIGGGLAAAFGLPSIFLITTAIFVLSTLWERKTSRNSN
ncbi:MAG: MFS transporter [Thermodesulfobacteriota bacterium]|jgi:MFS family permease